MFVEQIKSVLSENATHLLDLYRKFDTNMSFDAFSLFMNAGLERGDWVCESGVWKLPNPKIDKKHKDFYLPFDRPVNYLLNDTFQFTSPEQKNAEKLRIQGYFDSKSYIPVVKTFGEMIADNVSGYQVCPGFFKRNVDNKIRKKECWVSQQVFVLEFDDNVKENTLDEVIENSAFIRENACALIESIRSRYDDPNDTTCNGEMRYRVFFICPQPTNQIKQAEFFIKFLLDIFPSACPSGSNITNGAIGRAGTEYRVYQSVC